MDVDLIGWVGVGLGGTSGCRCGILYAPTLGVLFYAVLVSLDRLCGPVVRVSGYRYRGPGFDPRRYQIF